MNYSTVKKQSILNVKSMTVIAMMTALICVIAPHQIPIGPIPITLGTMILTFAAIVLGWKKGVACCFLYLLLGAVGLPVFSGMQGGLAKLTGSTGGYLAGFLALTAIGGLIYEAASKLFAEKRLLRCSVGVLGFLVGTAVLYVIGTIYYMALSGNSLSVALSFCVTPFIPFDIVKTILAVLLAEVVKPRLKQAGIVE